MTKKKRSSRTTQKEDVSWAVKSNLKTRVSLAAFFDRRGYKKLTTQRLVKRVELERKKKKK